MSRMRKLIRKVKQDCRQQQNGKFAGCLPALRQEGVYVRRGQLKDSIPMSVQDDWFDPVPPPDRATADLSPPINADQVAASSSSKNSHQFFILFRRQTHKFRH
ncbi:hypothetical protein PCANC_00372 [Puccinia coronata f. sp. avenae]|uniref:Uncharacterized protein n=1 Tax=Puccinia coronata f. sp. avenae TaxID=200324 RepID=A0A2N5W9F5_9BASI|nr:hypothetical protein PCANC_00372 [Puccinia coronata f. sp. avenae]